MKNLIKFLILSIITMSCSVSKNTNFNLLFGSGFKNDNVSLEINDTLIVENQIMITDSIIGIVNSNNISYQQGILNVSDKKGNVLKKIPMIIDAKKIKFTIIINKNPYLFYSNLNKGTNMVFNKDKYYYNVYLNQNKKIIKLE
ncbi:MAG: hypothetical protein ACOVO2_25355 [Emticicia sp.]|uniref:hypothetical protein n=1 Tax=Emticicia sp. TaxID=1930953 RepID=UPI003BA4BDBA